MRRLAASLALAVPLFACAGPGDRAPELQATVYRDTWGIPHVYADSAAAGLYASGWAQAEDRLEQILKNYLLGLGEHAAAFGPGDDDEWVRSDLESLMWDHYGTARRNYQRLHPTLREHLAAFVDGIRDYMAAHPDEVPAWWGGREVDVYLPVAFSRQFIWGWPAGQAASDLRAIGLRPSYDVDLRASNEIALAPSRTTFGAAALIIDPHLSWFGRQRYWEVRLHAGDLHISGFATAGFPYVNLGHNRRVAWAHTTGGPDTADVYELALDPEDPTRYRYDGEWRELTSRTVEVAVKGEAEPRRHTFWFSHHGPIVARQGERAYAAALAYADEIGYLESKYWFMVAEDVEGAKKALEVRQIMPQNVMVADLHGDIYYQRTGRVPIRPAGHDWSRPVDGSTSATEWRGIHPTSDLISLANPERGYLQNNNIGPDVMLVGSPLTPDRWPEYLYNQPALFTHQRGSVAVALLEAKERWSEQDLLALAVDTTVYQAERWQAELERAAAASGARLSAGAATVLERIRAWDRRADAGSNGALLYAEWRAALRETLGAERMAALTERVDDYLVLFRDAPLGADQRPGVESADLPPLVEALERAAERVATRPRGLDTVFGDVYRVGRLDAEEAGSGDGVSWPVGGGSQTELGMATLRAIGFGPERSDGTRWGNRGQTSTELVILTDPIRSWTQPPIGQSDRRDSPHWRDQAEKLFSTATLKPSWFAKEELLDGHVASQQTLVYRPR
jgi:acyl-homoserine-lactone acylase